MEGFDAHKGATITAAHGQMASTGREALEVVFDSLSTEQGRTSLYARIAPRSKLRFTDGTTSLPDPKSPHLTPREIAHILNTALELEGRDKFTAIRAGVTAGRRGLRKRGGEEVRISKEWGVETLWEVDEEGGAKIPDSGG